MPNLSALLLPDLMTVPLMGTVFSSTYWPFVVLAVSVAFIIFGIGKWRLHPFLALILAALVAGLLAGRDAWPVVNAGGKEVVYGPYLGVVELIAKGFGDTARGIALSIALASIIGLCLMESGAADKVVRRFLAFFGEKHAGWALLWSTYLLSVPIFFDTMFMLMAPLAKALRLRTGKDYMLYVLCTACGGVITHSLTVPHPGPIAMVENLKVDVGFSILAGFVGGLIPAVVGFFACVWLNSRMDVPLRDTPGTSLDELRKLVDKDERELPGLLASLTPVILPILLISGASFFKVAADTAKLGAGWSQSFIGMFGGPDGFQAVRHYVDFIGDKNIALGIGAVIALVILARQRGYGLAAIEKMMGPPIETAAVIILITSAGGAFGFMLRSVGVGDAIKALAAGSNLNLLLLAYVVASVIRIAQGSATVAMLTTSAMIAPMLEGAVLPFHTLYVFLVIGWGAMTCSWMNDSGFWVVSRLGGLTERETLRSWTVMLTIVSLAGFIVTFIASKLLPMV
jgi:GntP family gluconate:H+ symporter